MLWGPGAFPSFWFLIATSISSGRIWKSLNILCFSRLFNSNWISCSSTESITSCGLTSLDHALSALTTQADYCVCTIVCVLPWCLWWQRTLHPSSATSTGRCLFPALQIIMYSKTINFVVHVPFIFHFTAEYEIAKLNGMQILFAFCNS